MNAPQCYVILTLPVLSRFRYAVTSERISIDNTTFKTEANVSSETLADIRLDGVTHQKMSTSFYKTSNVQEENYTELLWMIEITV
jgi:hypothetical protein